MLQVNQLTGFGSGGRPSTPFAEFRGYRSSDSNLSSYSFTDVDIGEPASNRVVVVCAHAAAGSGTSSLTGCTINGVSATILRGGLGNADIAGIAYAVVPAGTVVTVSVTYGTTYSRTGISVYSLYNLVSTTPDASAADGPTSRSASGTLNVQANSVVILSANWLSASGTIATDNGQVNVDASFTVENSLRVVSGHMQYPVPAKSSMNMTFTGGTGATDCDFVAACWR
jgi:hypothetical protein